VIHSRFLYWCPDPNELRSVEDTYQKVNLELATQLKHESVSSNVNTAESSMTDEQLELHCKVSKLRSRL